MIDTVGITVGRETGAFFCPACVNASYYTRKTVRRFLTIYFIPLIPLHVASDTLTCKVCNASFTPDVLKFDPEAYRQEFYSHLLRTLVLLAISEPTVKEAELRAIQSSYEATSGQPLSNESLTNEILLARQQNVSVVEYVRRIGLRLGEPAKVRIVQACFLTTTASGELTSNQQRLLAQFPAALGMSETRFRKIIEQTLQDA